MKGYESIPVKQWLVDEINNYFFIGQFNDYEAREV